MPILKPDHLYSALQSGKLGHIYIFDGPENWLKERALKQIIDKLLPKEERDLNLDRFDGETSSGGEIISTAQSMPFLSKKRVILVKSAEEFSSSDAKIISEGLANLPSSTHIFFLYHGKAGLRETLPATVGSLGSIITFWAPFPNQLPSWVVSEVRQRGKSIGFDAARSIAESCSDLQDISNEIDKLILFVGKKKHIDFSDVRLHGLPDGSADYNELEDSIWRRQMGKALYQAQLLGEMGIRGESLFPVFERVFRRLLLAHYYLTKKGWNRMDVFNELGLRGKTKQTQLDQGLRLYSALEVKRSFQRIVDANMDLKTGTLDSGLSVSLLIRGILGKKEEAVLTFG